jgi:3-phosphoshikimate 1-carboxyvinyltransferase
MSRQKLSALNSINGTLAFEGDKSISHRAVMFASLAEGTSVLENLSVSHDVQSTAAMFRALGVDAVQQGNTLTITSKGFKNFIEPKAQLDSGNSGTTARLMSGILSHLPFPTTVFGDASLSSRPMKRVINPIREMGAIIEVNDAGTLPITYKPSAALHAITYELPVPSAQVKSAVLLGGLFHNEKTCVIESEQTRNHTEILLNLETLSVDGKTHVFSSSKNFPVSQNYFIPGDISSSTFFIILTLLLKDSALLIKNVSLNPTRTAALTLLQNMGGDIAVQDVKTSSNEQYGNILVRSSNLHNVEIPKSIMPNIIDEIPALAIAGMMAEGEFKLSNAAELRVKESDRISAVVNNLKHLGLRVDEFQDGFSFTGKQNITNASPAFESYDDHRIAMAFSLAAFLMKDGAEVTGFDCIRISNPNFLNQIKELAK